jgi:hypothetical protein
MFRVCSKTLYSLSDDQAKRRSAQLRASAQNNPSHCPIWGLGSSLGASSLPRSFILHPYSDSSCIGIWEGGSPALAKVECSAYLSSSPHLPFLLSFEVEVENSGAPGHAGWLSRISRVALRCFRIKLIFQTRYGRRRNSRSPENLNDVNVR